MLKGISSMDRKSKNLAETRERRIFSLLKNYLFSKKAIASTMLAIAFCCGGYASAGDINIKGGDEPIVNNNGGTLEVGTVTVENNTVTNKNETGDTNPSTFKASENATFTTTDPTKKAAFNNTGTDTVNPVAIFTGKVTLNDSDFKNENATATLTGGVELNTSVDSDGNFLKDADGNIIQSKLSNTDGTVTVGGAATFTGSNLTNTLSADAPEGTKAEVTLGDAGTFTNGAEVKNDNGTVAVTGAATFTGSNLTNTGAKAEVTLNNNATFNGSNLTNSTAGIVTLNGSGKFTNGAVISNGSLQIGDDGKPVINEAGKLVVNADGGTIEIYGEQNLDPEDKLFLDDTVAFISSGTVVIGNESTSVDPEESLPVTHLEIKQVDGVYRTFGEGAVTVGKNGVLDTDLGTFQTISDLAINGTVNLQKEGAGSVTVANTNYTQFTTAAGSLNALGTKYQNKNNLRYDLTGETIRQNGAEIEKINADILTGSGLFTLDLISQVEGELGSTSYTADRCGIISKEMLSTGNSAEGYTGSTTIKTGTLIIDGTYGAANSTGTFTVEGLNVDSGKLLSAGTVAFNGSDATLNADTVNFKAGGAENVGAGLWFNATDSKTIATINAKTINFDNSNTVYYDGISRLDHRAERTIAIADNATVTGDVNQIFKTDLVAASQDATYKDITLTVNDIGSGSDWGINDEQAGNFNAERKLGIKHDVYEALYNEKDHEKVKAALHDMTFGGGGIGALTDMIGSVGSVFSGLSSSQNRYQNIRKPEYQATGMNGPGQSTIADNTKSASENNSKKNSLWGSYSYTSMEGDQYIDEQGVDHQGYFISRNGILLGKRKQASDTFSYGLVVSLANPRLCAQREFQTSNAYTRYEGSMTDLQFGFHMEKTFAEHWETSFFIGGGAQYLRWDRMIKNLSTGENISRFRDNTTGNTFAVTAYLARRIDMTKHWALRPTVGIDSNHSWLFGIDEDMAMSNGGTTGSEFSDTQNRSLHVDNFSYDQNTARFGLSSSWTSPEDYFGLNLAIFYGRLLDEKDYVVVNGSFVGDISSTNMDGHRKGYDSINVGGGTYGYLNKDKTFSINGTYNALFYKRATTLNCTGGVAYRY